jgi:hypothetical protein
MLFSLDAGAPANATVDPVSGVFRWTPTPAQAPSTNLWTLRVTDTGNPSLTHTQAFRVLALPELKVIKLDRLPGNSNRVTWQSHPGIQYQLQGRDAFTTSTWQTLSGTVTASAPLTFLTNAGGTATQRFYRILQLP